MWQRRHECNFLGRHGRPETPPGVGQQFKAQVFVCRNVVLDDDEGLDDLAGQHIRLADEPASATAGCSINALSTSKAPIRWPEDLITSSLRPTNQ